LNQCLEVSVLDAKALVHSRRRAPHASAVDWRRIAPRVVIGLLALLFAAELFAGLFWARGTLVHIGHDYALYMDATRSWLNGGPFYHPYQVAGPYVVKADEILYPPHALLLFLPFTFLPAILWWAIPLAILAVGFWRARPGPWTVAFAIGCLCIPKSMWLVTSGSPTMWVAAGLALGRLGWPAAGALVKPTLFPMILVGLRRRSFWVAAGLLGAIDVALLGLSIEYVSVVRHATGPLATVIYSAGDLGIMGIGLIGWLGSRTWIRADELPPRWPQWTSRLPRLP
jgi:hypothetical protein